MPPGDLIPRTLHLLFPALLRTTRMNGTWIKSRINDVCSVSLFSHIHSVNTQRMGGAVLLAPHSFVRVSARSLFHSAPLGLDLRRARET